MFNKMTENLYQYNILLHRFYSFIQFLVIVIKYIMFLYLSDISLKWEIKTEKRKLLSYNKSVNVSIKCGWHSSDDWKIDTFLMIYFRVHIKNLAILLENLNTLVKAQVRYWGLLVFNCFLKETSKSICALSFQSINGLLIFVRSLKEHPFNF